MLACEERSVVVLKRAHKEARDSEEEKSNEITRLKGDLENVRVTTDERIGKIRTAKDELVSELERLNMKLSSERAEHDDALRDLRKQLKEEEQVLCIILPPVYSH